MHTASQVGRAGNKGYTEFGKESEETVGWRRSLPWEGPAGPVQAQGTGGI